MMPTLAHMDLLNDESLKKIEGEKSLLAIRTTYKNQEDSTDLRSLVPEHSGDKQTSMLVYILWFKFYLTILSPKKKPYHQVEEQIKRIDDQISINQDKIMLLINENQNRLSEWEHQSSKICDEIKFLGPFQYEQKYVNNLNTKYEQFSSYVLLVKP